MRKRELQADIDRLHREEAADIRKLTGGQPAQDWSPELTEEVVRVQNAYEDARGKKRGELVKYL